MYTTRETLHQSRKGSGCCITTCLTTRISRGEVFLVKSNCVEHSSLFLLHRCWGEKCETDRWEVEKMDLGKCALPYIEGLKKKKKNLTSFLWRISVCPFQLKAICFLFVSMALCSCVYLVEQFYQFASLVLRCLVSSWVQLSLRPRLSPRQRPWHLATKSSFWTVLWEKNVSLYQKMTFQASKRRIVADFPSPMSVPNFQHWSLGHSRDLKFCPLLVSY